MIRDVSPSIEDVHLKSRSEEKEKTLKLIEQKLKSYEEKKELEGSNQPKAVKKKGHFWSDCKVQLIFLVMMQTELSKTFCLLLSVHFHISIQFIHIFTTFLLTGLLCFNNIGFAGRGSCRV